MQLLNGQLDVNSCAGDIEEYLTRFSFWQDSHEEKMSPTDSNNEIKLIIRGAYDKFPDFFSYGHLKLL